MFPSAHGSSVESGYLLLRTITTCTEPIISYRQMNESCFSVALNNTPHHPQRTHNHLFSFFHNENKCVGRWRVACPPAPAPRLHFRSGPTTKPCQFPVDHWLQKRDTNRCVARVSDRRFECWFLALLRLTMRKVPRNRSAVSENPQKQ